MKTNDNVLVHKKRFVNGWFTKHGKWNPDVWLCQSQDLDHSIKRRATQKHKVKKAEWMRKQKGQLDQQSEIVEVKLQNGSMRVE